MGRCGRGRKGRAGPSAHVSARGLPGGGSGSVDLLGSDGSRGSEPLGAQGGRAGPEAAGGAAAGAPPPGMSPLAPPRRPRLASPSSPAPRPQVSRILRKAAAERSAEEGRLLAESEDLVTELQGRSRRREGLKRRQEEASPARARVCRASRRAGGGAYARSGCLGRCVTTRRSCGGKSGSWPEPCGTPSTWSSTLARGSAR